VPAIMSARSIENRKERLLTILVTPLMSCSARLPVYSILIALVIPAKFYLGFLSLQGLVMMALYLFGTAMALLVSHVFKWFIRIQEKSFFILELPVYRGPRWKNILVTMVEKARIFVFDAGKVIMLISLVLWVLSSYGPKERMAAATGHHQQKVAQNKPLADSLKKEYDALVAGLEKQPQGQALIDSLAKPHEALADSLERLYKTELLENSYAGIMGKALEPAIRPLGYDWKIGIALVTSFAAREVFVGTMATLYSVGEESDGNNTLRQKMQMAVRSDGRPTYTLATGLSLMMFYLLAMQCMSTLAVVKRETKSWKWPLLQLLYMTVLAYFFSWLVYTLAR
jgi:ferrous iron transport protein B